MVERGTNRDARRTATLALIALAAVAPARSQGPALAVLARLEPGQWEIRDAADRRILRDAFCIGDPMRLTQPQHRAARCRRSVVAAESGSATVHYSCPSAGFGRTTIRYETPRLARVESQGIDRGTPFAFRAQARRVGACARGGSR